MNSLDSVIEKANSLVTPSRSEEQRLKRVAKMMLERIERVAKEYSAVKGIVLGGSFAKGTWLPGETDIDIFVLLDKSLKDEEFEKIGLEIGREAGKGFKVGKRYAQHPYIEVLVGNVRVNVVPCYDVVRGEWRSAADRSLYHLELVNERMDIKMKHEVRLLKRFMRSLDVYGAEIEKEGFSGYAAEVLVLNHGSFHDVLKYFSSISWEKPFTLRDPIDQNRDLAKAISNEKLATMILASRAFLSKPSIRYFTSVRRKVRNKMKERLYCLLFKHKVISEDILWGELKRTSRKIVARLAEIGFTIVRFDQCNRRGQSAILMLPLNEVVPRLEIKVGPPVAMRENCEKFLKENKQDSELVFVNREGRIVALKKKKFYKLKEALDYIASDKAETVGISKDLREGILRNRKVLSGRELLNYARKLPWVRECIRRIVSDTVGTS